MTPASDSPSQLCPALLALLASVTSLVLFTETAQADLRICNMTSSRVGVAIGYRGEQGWVTEGWWNLEPKAPCETLIPGKLTVRFYYIYATDYDRGGAWSGHTFMCTKDREFKIHGIDDCFARGFERSGFLELDTGKEASWIIQLTDPSSQGGAFR